MAFVDKGDERWACFLATYPTAADTWHGYFAFRPSHGDLGPDEVRTTDIFVEASEAEIHLKARSLGRPLLSALLESAIHTRARNGDGGPRLRGRFRSLLAESSKGDWTGAPPMDTEIERLRSLYSSYRLDQVVHMICLVDPDDFEAAVDRILDGGRIDFRAKDRLQFAMLVVDHIERLLPLPDFETWARDYQANPEAYRLYAHTLHREGRLP